MKNNEAENHTDFKSVPTIVHSYFAVTKLSSWTN